jgi:membrane protein DedA with SNARE-associated domain
MILDHAEWFLFAWVLSNQIGVLVLVVRPVLGAGAAVGASPAADVSWYALGRWRGTETLKTLGRVSPIVGTSVHRVRHIFAAHREACQVSTRFLTELNASVAGLAGASKVSIVRFVCDDSVSALTCAPNAAKQNPSNGRGRPNSGHH